jgi:osmoprotectant transport system ATP-binding protein
MDRTTHMIELENLHKTFDGRTVIDGLSLRIETGELFVLVGASGSGKSTLLRMINRLIEADSGRIAIDGEDVRAIAPESLRRRIGYAIQSVGLFPHWTVAANIATVPRLLGWPRERVERRVAELLALLQLDEPGIAERRPHELSGGQQQRIGVARALAADPAIVLMDEPFGALDPLTREALQDNLKSIQRATGKTIVFVTHDMDEALRLGDRIALIDGGHIRQCGTPRELLGHPVDDKVAHFVGGSAAALRLLGVRRVREVMRAGDGQSGPDVDIEASLRDALALMLGAGRDTLSVRDTNGPIVGVLRLADLVGTPP